MELKEVNDLSKGDTVYHERYGKAHFIEVIPGTGDIFGVTIQPATLLGMLILFRDSDTHIPHFLVDNIKDIKEEITKGFYKDMIEEPDLKQLSEIWLSMVEMRKAVNQTCNKE